VIKEETLRPGHGVEYNGGYGSGYLMRESPCLYGVINDMIETTAGLATT
jgi:hypothetical protein